MYFARYNWDSVARHRRHCLYVIAITCFTLGKTYNVSVDIGLARGGPVTCTCLFLHSHDHV